MSPKQPGSRCVMYKDSRVHVHSSGGCKQSPAHRHVAVHQRQGLSKYWYSTPPRAASVSERIPRTLGWIPSLIQGDQSDETSWGPFRSTPRFSLDALRLESIVFVVFVSSSSSALDSH